MTRNNSNIEDLFTVSLLQFHNICGPESLKETVQEELQTTLEIDNDIPLLFVGQLYPLIVNSPQAYWNRQVATETFSGLSDLYKQDSDKFITALMASFYEFFAAINAYQSIIDTYLELKEVAFEESLKTRLFRNSIYTRICEDCLMNFYRCIRNIFNEYSVKEYSSQNTLGAIIPALEKNGFSALVDIDVDVRNAINHGNVAATDKEIRFRYRSGSSYQSKSLQIWEYDNLIDTTLDIATGIWVGVLRFFCNCPNATQGILSQNVSKEVIFEWFRLFYKTEETQIQLIDEAILGDSQLNLRIQTSIADKNLLMLALTEIAKGVYAIFPEYQRYLIGYQHSRSIGGFMRYTQQMMQTHSFDNIALIKAVLASGDVLVWDVRPGGVNERAYKYHVFPKVSGRNWTVTSISDCSTGPYKRIKAQLVIREVLSDKILKSIIQCVIDELKVLYTPENPHEDVPFGEIEAHAVFLNVHYQSDRRTTFTLLPSNEYFICCAYYYQTSQIGKMTDGGIPANLWKQLRKSNYRGIELAWNPNRQMSS
ncbi:MAG: hypothetical protein H6641_15580 [Caldilineaceae bacterium]|nr:hypothetical protein [Caldilineaceae bacterium]